jgi:hypothetical protein
MASKLHHSLDNSTFRYAKRALIPNRFSRHNTALGSPWQSSQCEARVTGLVEFCEQSLSQQASLMLPIVRDSHACRDCTQWEALDSLCQVSMRAPCHVESMYEIVVWRCIIRRC